MIRVRPSRSLITASTIAEVPLTGRHLRPAVTALAVGNVGKQRDAATGGQASDEHATGGGSNRLTSRSAGGQRLWKCH